MIDYCVTIKSPITRYFIPVEINVLIASFGEQTRGSP